MKNYSRHIQFLTIVFAVIINGLLASCYRDAKTLDEDHDALAAEYSESQLDSISFYSKHHFTEGYNFLVHTDSIILKKQQPEEIVSQLETDSFPVFKDHQIVVGDIRIIPQDSIDSVWVQVATDEGEFGWIHETEMLPNVVPIDPISQFIMFFSDTHIILSLIILVLIGLAYLSRKIYKRNAPLVHLRDIPSFYPTLLCLIVASSATFYASLQMFAPETWRHFYYHPSLNPLQMPFILSIFISSVWAMLIVGIAVIDDTRHHLNISDNILYLSGLLGVCALNYIIFSVSTLYYIGYPLLVLYYWYAIRTYFGNTRNHFICGNCGKHIPSKGRCPYCGSINA